MKLFYTIILIVVAWFGWDALEPLANTPNTRVQSGALMALILGVLVLGGIVFRIWRAEIQTIKGKFIQKDL